MFSKLGFRYYGYTVGRLQTKVPQTNHKYHKLTGLQLDKIQINFSYTRISIYHNSLSAGMTEYQ